AQQVKPNVLGLDGRMQANGDAHQSEGERTSPDGFAHGSVLCNAANGPFGMAGWESQGVRSGRSTRMEYEGRQFRFARPSFIDYTILGRHYINRTIRELRGRCKGTLPVLH